MVDGITIPMGISVSTNVVSNGPSPRFMVNPNGVVSPVSIIND